MTSAPSVRIRSREPALDWEAFERQADQMLLDLATATDSPPDALQRSSAESLVVLRNVGDLVLPALRAAAADSETQPLRDLIDGPIADVVAVASHGCLSPKTLWGNVASVIESSARIIAAENSGLGTRAAAIATETLGFEPLADCWNGEVGTTFRRTSCCLVSGPDPGDMRCGDCVRGSSSR